MTSRDSAVQSIVCSSQESHPEGTIASEQTQTPEMNSKNVVFNGKVQAKIEGPAPFEYKNKQRGGTAQKKPGLAGKEYELKMNKLRDAAAYTADKQSGYGQQR